MTPIAVSETRLLVRVLARKTLVRRASSGVCRLEFTENHAPLPRAVCAPPAKVISDFRRKVPLPPDEMVRFRQSTHTHSTTLNSNPAGTIRVTRNPAALRSAVNSAAVRSRPPKPTNMFKSARATA